MSDEDAVQAMVDAAVLAFGGLDLVVNNAGLSLSKSLLETTAADWDLQHNVMAKGSFLVSKAAAKVLIEQELGGDIVYISSKNSIFAGPNNIAYSATKADQAHQVRLLAAELGEHGVKVNGDQPRRRRPRLRHLRRRLGRQPGRGLRRRGGGPRQVLRAADPAQARGAARERRQRGLRALQRRPVAHHRAARPGRRGRGGGLPAMSTSRVRVVAVDLGATSGRVMVAEVGPDTLALEEVHRFPNGPVDVGGLAALGRARRCTARCSPGCGWPRRAGRSTGSASTRGRSTTACSTPTSELLGNPFAYRDSRTDGVAAQVLNKVDARELYERTGVQQLPFNTIYQLVAAAGTPALEQAVDHAAAARTCWASGSPGRSGAERTNASTTGLYDVRSGEWATDLADRVGIPSGILPPLRSAGRRSSARCCRTSPAAVGLGADVPVIAVGSHDTASAVVAVPAGDEPSAYISSGTWSLVGLELDEPVLTEAARLADFTNEGGVDGTIRFLKNVMGLWVLSESLRAWDVDAAASCSPSVAEAEPLRTVVDINDPSLLPPGDMPARIAALAAAGRRAGAGDAGRGGALHPRQPGRWPTGGTCAQAAELAGPRGRGGARGRRRRRATSCCAS